MNPVNFIDDLQPLIDRINAANGSELVITAADHEILIEEMDVPLVIIEGVNNLLEAEVAIISSLPEWGLYL